MTAAAARLAGDSALLLQWEAAIDPAVNARAVAVAQAVQAANVAGVRDVVPTYRSVAVHLDPLRTDVDAVRRMLERGAASDALPTRGRRVEVPVTYGGDAGPDLEEVAARTGLSVEEVIARHAGVEYRVFMMGFLPGFAYLGTVDERIATPRRSTPRVRVPAGSVGIAGRQSGVYPIASPAGWQIIGRTPLPVFDPQRTPAALFAPGDSVTFVRTDARRGAAFDRPAVAPSDPSGAVARTGIPLGRDANARDVTVLRPGLFTTVQDRGRWGYQSSGVPVSGAMDPVAHRIANAVVGNPPAAATLEATLVGPELRFGDATTIAIAGADLSATVDATSVPMETAVRCRPGSILRFGQRRAGARAYVAFDGGIDVPLVLGSRSTHLLSNMGGVAGRALRAGDILPLGPPVDPPVVRRRSAEPPRSTATRLRVLAGPQREFFEDEALELLQRTRFTVGSESDRVGYRLHADVAIPHADERVMISDATFSGAVQVPASGQPILLMADRQTTGGYPQIAVVITADLSKAAQLAPGDGVEFELCSPAQAISALLEQESKLLAIT